MTRRQAGIFCGFAIAGLVGGSALARNAEREPRPLLVGVVDLGVVLLRYNKTIEVGRQIEGEKATMAHRMAEHKRAVDALRNDLEATADGAPDRRAKEIELDLLKKGLEAMQQECEAILARRSEALTVQVIDEIDSGVREFARAHHYDLIVKTTTKGWGETKLPERLYRAQISTVVAYDPKLDVTEAILMHLNEPAKDGAKDMYH